MEKKGLNSLIFVWLCIFAAGIILFTTIPINAQEKGKDLVPPNVKIPHGKSSMSPSSPEEEKKSESEEPELNEEEEIPATTRGPLPAPSKIILPKETLRHSEGTRGRRITPLIKGPAKPSAK